MRLGIPREIRPGETRVAATPATVRKFRERGIDVIVERGAGLGAHVTDADFEQAGALLGDAAAAFGADLVLKVRRPLPDEVHALRAGAVLVGMLELCEGGVLAELAAAGVDAFALERLPRVSRAQAMDVLSSQANIAGYRAVLEAARLYGRFLPMLMTAAGSAKPARALVLGAGVAGLQAIATARRLGAQVFAYDVRPEVKEQVASLGARYVELDIGESGAGSGGYARELSAAAKARQQDALTAEIARFDIVIATAALPCRTAPELITAEAVQRMAQGSVIVDLAAASGGNCRLSEPDRTIVRHGVTLCGITNFPALLPADASHFYARNLMQFVDLLLRQEAQEPVFADFEADELTRACLVVRRGEILFQAA